MDMEKTQKFVNMAAKIGKIDYLQRQVRAERKDLANCEREIEDTHAAMKCLQTRAGDTQKRIADLCIEIENLRQS
jgi:hypothetical protein